MQGISEPYDNIYSSIANWLYGKGENNRIAGLLKDRDQGI